MALSDETIKQCARRLQQSRMRILTDHGFYGLLLMHMIFSIDENCRTAATDGKRIVFNPKFLDEIDDFELDFVLMHEILHVALQHWLRRGERDRELFNIACDIVVNSNILYSECMNVHAISLRKYGESIHLAPNGKEGYEYTAEQVYDMLLESNQTESPSDPCRPKPDFSAEKRKNSSNADKAVPLWDDHSRWTADEGNLSEQQDIWTNRILKAYEAVSGLNSSDGRGEVPLCVERAIHGLKNPQVDWRKILNDFVQEEIVDYSFLPPDRRFEESPFFLPDFNCPDVHPHDILFMIDTSGSMSDDAILTVYSEIKGAIDRYNGKLKGWLGFFDAEAVAPEPFEDEASFRLIKPKGGGGTDFQVIFDYVRQHMKDELPSCIVILTDGYAPFPKEKEAMGIPVLWLLINEEVQPPWGRIARIHVDEEGNR